jgi:hypothetical protein
MRYGVRMARTFVRVELVTSDVASAGGFDAAMAKAGFSRTVKGRRSHRALRLPEGMYVIAQITPVEALELTRDVARDTKVEARIFCLPVTGGVKFGNLMVHDDPSAAVLIEA